MWDRGEDNEKTFRMEHHRYVLRAREVREQIRMPHPRQACHSERFLVHGRCGDGRNPVLTRTFHTINARVQALRFRTNQDGAKWQRAVKEHENMIEALAAHDGAAMREVLQQHLRNKRDVVLEQLREAAGKARGAA